MERREGKEGKGGCMAGVGEGKHDRLRRNKESYDVAGNGLEAVMTGVY